MSDTQELFPGGITYKAFPGTFPLSTDTMVLSWFVRLPREARVADLGSAGGALGLMLCGRDPLCRVTGLEVRESAHENALQNIRDNSLEGRLASVLGNVKDVSSLLPAGSFTTVVSNPPYFPGGPGSSAARKELEGTLEDFFRAASRLLQYGGDFFLVHRPERLADLMVLGRASQLEPKELRFVRHDPEAIPSLVLLSCRKGGKPGLKLLPDLILHDGSGRITEEYRQIYHL